MVVIYYYSNFLSVKKLNIITNNEAAALSWIMVHNSETSLEIVVNS